MICKRILLIIFPNVFEFILCPQFNGFKYIHLKRIILFSN